MPKRNDFEGVFCGRYSADKRVKLTGPNELGNALNALRSCASLCDVVIIVQGEKFPCHRAVLAAASPFFAKMFTNGMRETTEKEIPLHELRHRIWSVVLDYIYTSEIYVTSIPDMMKIIEVSNRYELLSLGQVVIDFLIQQLSNNWEYSCELYAFAEKHSLGPLREKAKSCVTKNFDDVCLRPSFVKLDVELIEEVIQSPTLVVSSERKVFDAVLGWLCAPEPLQWSDYDNDNVNDNDNSGDELEVLGQFSCSEDDNTEEPRTVEPSQQSNNNNKPEENSSLASAEDDDDEAEESDEMGEERMSEDEMDLPDDGEEEGDDETTSILVGRTKRPSLAHERESKVGLEPMFERPCTPPTRIVRVNRGRERHSWRLLQHVDLSKLQSTDLRGILTDSKVLTGDRRFIPAVERQLVEVPQMCGCVDSRHYIPRTRGTRTLSFTYRHFGITQQYYGSADDDWEVQSPWVSNGDGIFWRMELFPKGDQNGRHRYFAVYLRAKDSTKTQGSVKTEAQLFVVGKNGKADLVCPTETSKLREFEESSFGDPQFCELRNIDEYVHMPTDSIVLGATIYLLEPPPNPSGKEVRRRKRSSAHNNIDSRQ